MIPEILVLSRQAVPWGYHDQQELAPHPWFISPLPLFSVIFVSPPAWQVGAVNPGLPASPWHGHPDGARHGGGPA